MKYNTDLAHTLNLKNKGILDISIPRLKLLEIIKIQIPLEYLLNGEKEHDILEIMMDQEHPAYSYVVEKHSLSEGNVDINELIKFESISIAIQEFFDGIFKELYRE